MEFVEFEFFGVKKSSSETASAFSNPSYLKKRGKAFLKKIRKRIDDVVTNDETLRLLLINDIDRLNKEGLVWTSESKGSRTRLLSSARYIW